MNHGSATGAASHYRRGVKPCESCAVARREYQRRRYRLLHVRRLMTPERIVDFLLMNEPASMQSIVEGVAAAEATVLRAVYRMRGRGEITCNPDTRHYTISRQEG